MKETEFFETLSSDPNWEGLSGDAGADPYWLAVWLLDLVRRNGYEIVKKEKW